MTDDELAILRRLASNHEDSICSYVRKLVAEAYRAEAEAR
jgi:hypothetical protein